MNLDRATKISSKTDFRIGVIRDPAEFASLADEWDRLAANLGDRSLFCSHAWISRSWLRHETLRNRTMHIITIRDRGELVLAAPFVRIGDWFGTATLVWLDSMTPQYNDIPVANDHRLAAIEPLFWNYIRRNHRIRALKLSGVREDSLTARLLRSGGARPTWETVAQSLDLSPFSDGEAFFASRSYNTRYNFRRHMRLLERQGTPRFRTIDVGTEREAAIRWIFEKKEKWVEARHGEPNWVSAEGTVDFFVDIAALEAKRAGASVLALELNGALISATLTFHRGKTVFASKLAYDPTWKAASPGWLVMIHILREACHKGLLTADLMIGRDEWKDRLHAGDVAVRNYRLSNSFWLR